MTTFTDATTIAAQRLASQYRTSGIFDGNFWFGGNALHAYLRSLVAAERTDDDQLLRFAYDEVFIPAVRAPAAGWWRDDYGWWGAAFCTAIRNRDALGYGDTAHDALFNDLLAAAVTCWKMLDAYWRDTPYTSESDNAVGSADIRGGAFNDGPDEPLPPMSGRNTVTNAGFWLLSLDLMRLTDAVPVARRANELATWFGAWIQAGALMNGQGLILERPTGNSTVPNWYWSGDQGVVMIDLLRQLTHQMPPPYTGSPAAVLAQATIRAMTVDGILHENLDFQQQLDQFSVDYATGKGIFMRHLGDVCRILGLEWTEKACGGFLRTNASAVWNSRDQETGQLRANWDSTQDDDPITGKTLALRELVIQASGLDALSVAAAFWPSGNIGERHP